MAKIRIGRSANNDVVLKDTTVSRNHAEIEDIGGGLYRLTDVGSSAGTFLKQGDTWSQITSAEIGADAQVRFGEAEIMLSDIVSNDPATVAPRAGPGPGASGIGQRAEKGAAEISRQGAGTGGARTGGGGWSGLSPNYKIGIIVGSGAFVLLIVVAVVLSLAGGEGAITAIGGPTGGGPAGGGVRGGGATGGGVSGSAAKARLEQVMITSCTKRGRNQDVCRCVAKNIVAGISHSDASAIVNAQRGGGKPPPDVMRKFLASAFAAGRTCAKRSG